MSVGSNGRTLRNAKSSPSAEEAILVNVCMGSLSCVAPLVMFCSPTWMLAGSGRRKKTFP